MRKSVLVMGLAALVSGTPVVSAPAAAKVNIDIDISIGSPINFGRRISCEEGRWRLRERGFREVRAIECRGKNYTYRAWRRDRQYRVVVRAKNGRIVDVDQIRW